MSKEAWNATASPPPRRPIASPQPAIVVPLDVLWERLPQPSRQDLLEQLTRILTQRLTSLNEQEAADE